MLDASLAARYANALFSCTQSHDCTAAVLEELGSFIRILSADRHLQQFFHHPAIPPAEKKQVLDAVAEKRMLPISHRFLSILLDAKRINYLPLVHETVVELFNRFHNRVKVGIASVFPLDGAMRRRVKESVERYLQKEIELDFTIDPSLLGGVKLTVEDRVIDGSVLNMVKKLENRIALG